MVRTLLAAIAGIVVWFVCAIGVGSVLPHVWADYAAVAKTEAFTVPMLAARLGISFLASLIGGLAASAISRERRNAALAMGVIMLVMFVPYHLSAAVWPNFPVWYHLTFFASLLILPLIGARLSPQR